jgi:hypothetical protein
MFSPYGQVISTRILRDANQQSRGVGFARSAEAFLFGQFDNHASTFNATGTVLFSTGTLLEMRNRIRSKFSDPDPAKSLNPTGSGISALLEPSH